MSECVCVLLIIVTRWNGRIGRVDFESTPKTCVYRVNYRLLKIIIWLEWRLRIHIIHIIDFEHLQTSYYGHNMILYMKMGNRNEKEQQRAFEMVHQAEKKKHNATETLFIKIPRVFRWDRDGACAAEDVQWCFSHAAQMCERSIVIWILSNWSL